MHTKFIEQIEVQTIYKPNPYEQFVMNRLRQANLTNSMFGMLM